MSIRAESFVVMLGDHGELRPASLRQESYDMGDNKVIHFEIVGRDGAALQRYYRDLFGWNFDTNNPGGYGFSSPEQTGVVVGVGSTPDGSAGHVTGYVNVTDIDATLARATELGGSVIMPKFSPAPNATLALLADPEGHILGLSQG